MVCGNRFSHPAVECTRVTIRRAELSMAAIYIPVSGRRKKGTGDPNDAANFEPVGAEE
jgi:hypothetical protein